MQARQTTFKKILLKNFDCVLKCFNELRKDTEELTLSLYGPSNKVVTLEQIDENTKESTDVDIIDLVEEYGLVKTSFSSKLVKPEFVEVDHPGNTADRKLGYLFIVDEHEVYAVANIIKKKVKIYVKYDDENPKLDTNPTPFLEGMKKYNNEGFTFSVNIRSLPRNPEDVLKYFSSISFDCGNFFQLYWAGRIDNLKSFQNMKIVKFCIDSVKLEDIHALENFTCVEELHVSHFNKRYVNPKPYLGEIIKLLDNNDKLKIYVKTLHNELRLNNSPDGKVLTINNNNTFTLDLSKDTIELLINLTDLVDLTFIVGEPDTKRQRYKFLSEFDTVDEECVNKLRTVKYEYNEAYSLVCNFTNKSKCKSGRSITLMPN